MWAARSVLSFALPTLPLHKQTLWRVLLWANLYGVLSVLFVRTNSTFAFLQSSVDSEHPERQTARCTSGYLICHLYKPFTFISGFVSQFWGNRTNLGCGCSSGHIPRQNTVWVQPSVCQELFLKSANQILNQQSFIYWGMSVCSSKGCLQSNILPIVQLLYYIGAGVFHAADLLPSIQELWMTQTSALE